MNDVVGFLQNKYVSSGYLKILDILVVVEFCRPLISYLFLFEFLRKNENFSYPRFYNLHYTYHNPHLNNTYYTLGNVNVGRTFMELCYIGSISTNYDMDKLWYAGRGNTTELQH